MLYLGNYKSYIPLLIKPLNNKAKDKYHKCGLYDTNELIKKKATTKTQQTYTHHYI